MQHNTLQNFPQISLALSQKSHNMARCWHWWRLKPSLMEQQRGMGPCQRAGQDNAARFTGAQHKQLPGN